ncbi:hypothetical protein [Taklimakanibacter deserti]
MIGADIIFLSAIGLAIAVGLAHRWLNHLRAERERRQRLDALTGRKD